MSGPQPPPAASAPRPAEHAPARRRAAYLWLDPNAAVAPAVRRLLTVAAVLVFLAGVQLFVFPLRTDTRFAWTIAPPMTAVFLGASYWASIGLELTASRSRRWGDAVIAIPSVFLFTAATLVVTLAHDDRFHFGAEHSGATRAVTWAWMGVYVVVPILMVLAVEAQARTGGAEPVPFLGADSAPSGDLGPIVRWTLVALAAGLTALGIALLADPTGSAEWWPWTLTPLTARAVGAWLVSLGVAAAHARLLDDVGEVRPLAITGLAFAVLQAVALVRHGDVVDWSTTEAVVLVTVLVVLAALSAAVLRPALVRRRRER